MRSGAKFTFIVICIYCSVAYTAAAERVALVIGNSNYIATSRLTNPTNDAKAVAIILRQIGFDVSEHADLTAAGMNSAVENFISSLHSAKVALFFYAGHGIQINDINFLIPIDAKFSAADDLRAGLYSVSKLILDLNQSGAASVIILDACRDNPISQTLPRGRGARSFTIERGLARGSVPEAGAASINEKGMLIAFATSPGNVALDGEGLNSPFTSALIKHLPTPGLEIRQMLTKVRADVAVATANKQIPWDNSSLFSELFLFEDVNSNKNIQSKTTGTDRNCFTFNGKSFCE
jgi:uncharacterized caspase-like protein